MSSGEITTITEDDSRRAVVELRLQGLGANRIAQETGLHLATVRRLLAHPEVREVVKQALESQLDAARLKLAEHAEDAAETIAMLATAGPASAADVPVDSLRLRAATTLLEQLSETAHAQGATVTQVNIDARSSTVEQRADAMALYLETVGEDDGE